MNRRSLVSSAGTLALFLVTCGAVAQQQSKPMPKAPAWGTTGFSVSTLGAWAFQPVDGAAIRAGDIDSGGRYIVSGGSCWAAPVALPTGAVIDHLELDGCDNSDSADLQAFLAWCSTGGLCAASYNTTSTGTPGCGAFVSMSAPTVVSNSDQTFTVKVCTPGGSDTTFTAVRIFYQLQVSPAPPSPTFLDVPTNNPYFQFVEALAASGITAGCGGGNFCPDSPVTRGQMATFLAKALGLYWPN